MHKADECSQRCTLAAYKFCQGHGLCYQPRTVLLKYNMIKTVHFNRNSESHNHLSMWKFACAIQKQVLTSTEVLALAFLCLGGQALTREYFNAPLATYLSLFCPVFFKIFFRVQNKTCLGVKKMSASDMLGSAQKLHVRDMNLGWTAKAKVDLSPESNNKGSLQCVRGGGL